MTQSAKILLGTLLMAAALIFMGCEGGGGVKGSKDTIQNQNSKKDTNKNLSSNSSEKVLSTTDDKRHHTIMHSVDRSIRSGCRYRTP